MLAVVIFRAGEPDRRKTFATAIVNIGRAPQNELVLDGDGIAEVHARFVRHEGKRAFVPLQHRHPTLYNHSRFLTPVVLRDHDRIGIGPFTLTFLDVPALRVDGRDVTVRAPIEAQLLDAIERGDVESRRVYADWLEAHGHDDQAWYLRTQLALRALSTEDPSFERTSDQLREVASRVDLAWRSRVAERPIEGCGAWDFTCPKEWSALVPSRRAGVRFCGSCRQDVYYCATIEEARDRAAAGHCVALDITGARWADDLAPPFGRFRCDRCDVDVGSGLASCPRCGEPIVTRMVTRGRMVPR